MARERKKLILLAIISLVCGLCVFGDQHESASKSQGIISLVSVTERLVGINFVIVKTVDTSDSQTLAVKLLSKLEA